MRTSNPALSEKTFQNLTVRDERMTIDGTVNKSFLLIFLVIIFASWSWYQVFPSGVETPHPSLPIWYMPTIFGTLVIGIVLIFQKKWAPVLAPVYAVGEGLLMGIVSALFEMRYPGIVFQAVLGTTGTFVALLLAYRSKLIPVTDNFRLGLVAATGGIAVVYLLEFALSFFGIRVPYIHESGTIGIAFSLFVVVIAALNLVLDFDFIENGAKRGAPKYMEWYAAFGLLVTLIWLYLEILRLLAKSRDRK